MTIEARVARLEGEREAALSEVERRDAGSLWDLVARGEFEKALAGWDLCRRIAWALRQAEREHDTVEAAARARAYGSRWKAILWPAGQPADIAGSELLADIKARMTAILVDEKTSDLSSSH